nr:hypothetical protein Iba_chr12dCG14800 [Ipomoea batatas]
MSAFDRTRQLEVSVGTTVFSISEVGLKESFAAEKSSISPWDPTEEKSSWNFDKLRSSILTSLMAETVDRVLSKESKEMVSSKLLHLTQVSRILTKSTSKHPQQAAQCVERFFIDSPPIGEAAADVGSTRLTTDTAPDARGRSVHVPSKANMSFLPESCSERLPNCSKSQTKPLHSALKLPCLPAFSGFCAWEVKGKSASKESRMAILPPPQA